MKNYTIPSTFFADVLQLDPRSQLYVLSTCQQLADSDESAIEQFDLPADAPAVLADFVKRLKRRVRSARRRRERPKPQQPATHRSPSYSASQSDNGVERPLTISRAIEMFKQASAFVLEMGDTFDLRQLKQIYRLVSKVLETFRADLYRLRRQAIRLSALTRSFDICPSPAC